MRAIFSGVLIFFLLFPFCTDADEINEIIVKANKVDEKSSDIKGSISVFDENSIEDLKIENMGDLAEFTPNFMLYKTGISGMNSPSIRGIHSDHHSHNVSAGIYVDGVPYLDAMGEYDQDLLNIESISVLRGPQGTLYGKSGQAGVINITTKKPGNEFMGMVSGLYASDEKKKTMLSLLGPICEDKIYFGLTGVFEEKDGFIENSITGDTVDDGKHFRGSGRLRFTPRENLDINLFFSSLRYDDGSGHMGLSMEGASIFKVPYHERKVESDFEGENTSKMNTASLVIDYDEILKNINLTSVSAFTDFDTDMKMDKDFTSKKISHVHNRSGHKKESQELRLSSSNRGLNWVSGIYFDRDKYDSEYAIDSDIPKKAGEFSNELESWSYSLFSNINLPVSKKFGATLGIRYDFQERKFSEGENSILGNWNEVSPKAGLNYKLKENILFYTSVSKGYVSGGFNPYAADGDYLRYDEEKLISYEAGAKQSFFNNRLVCNFAVFYMDFTDLHVPQILDESRPYTTNAGEATGKGLEIDITAKPFNQLTLFAGFGSSDVEFDEYKDNKGDYSGNKKPFAPEYSYNAGAKYRTNKGLFASINCSGYGKMYTDRENEDKRGEYIIVNFKTGYEFEKFDLYLYGSNIFDEEYNSIYNDFYESYSEPSEFGITATYRF